MHPMRDNGALTDKVEQHSFGEWLKQRRKFRRLTQRHALNAREEVGRAVRLLFLGDHDFMSKGYQP